MKQLLYFLVPFLILSCQKSETDSQPPTQNQTQFKTDSASITLSGNAGATNSFSIQSNINWAVTKSESWLNVSLTSGSGNGSIQVTAQEANNSNFLRTATIIITPVGNTSIQPISITVSQKTINPTMLWSKLYGGTMHDGASSVIVLPDGSYLVVGRSESNNADVSGNHGYHDAWVFKLDANGNKLWSKLYGGTRADYIHSIIATQDGGFLLVGSSESNNGDVSGNHGEYDAWAIKLDGNGNKLWSKLYGGASSDGARSIIAAPDGGYILVGYAYSNNGDVSGNKGWGDVWIMKLDANGNKIWGRLYGGTNDDDGKSIIATTDGAFLIAATTESNNGDVSGSHGGNDAWVIKIDRNGNKLWSKAYGGTDTEHTHSLTATTDGGFVMSGSTHSNNGDFSGNHGDWDAWILKLDGNGNKLWSKLYGGTGSDGAYSIITTAGGFVIAGNSYSNNGDVSGNHGGYDDAWIIRIDANGNKLWSKVYGGTGEDKANSIRSTADGSFIITGYTSSNNNDVSGNHGDVDAWVLKIKN